MYMSMLVDRKSNFQLNLPLSPQYTEVRPQCADVTTTPWWLVMGGVGVQACGTNLTTTPKVDARPTLVSLDTKPREVTADPFVCVCAEWGCHLSASSGVCGCGLGWRPASSKPTGAFRISARRPCWVPMHVVGRLACRRCSMLAPLPPTATPWCMVCT